LRTNAAIETLALRRRTGVALTYRIVREMSFQRLAKSEDKDEKNRVAAPSFGGT
jgi:hypothetical protein